MCYSRLVDNKVLKKKVLQHYRSLPQELNALCSFQNILNRQWSLEQSGSLSTEDVHSSRSLPKRMPSGMVVLGS